MEKALCMRYNWKAVQAEIDSGKTRTECLQLFGMNQSTWYLAAKNGFIVLPKIKKEKPLSEILIRNSKFNRYHLKKRLITSGLLLNECQICEQHSEWLRKPLVMVLDHINGISNDNRLENLRLLCPNCNSQQPTFAGRNVKLLRDSRFDS